jgi:hypothetical protein
MKKCILISVLSLVLTIAWGGQVLAQAQKEMTLTGTNYSGGSGKRVQLDQDHSVSQLEYMGVRVDDSGGGPFHGISTHIMLIAYADKGGRRFRGYETHTDKDGDKVVWEIMDSPASPGTGTGVIIGATGKFTGMQGAMEFKLQFPKPFPEGTIRLVCREVMKITTK